MKDKYTSRRAASTKTRIETRRHHGRYYNADKVAGRHPLKQGLKPKEFGSEFVAGASRRAASTKTRIETFLISNSGVDVRSVAGRHPLKQGLKLPVPESLRHRKREVAGRHPLKQGLKLLSIITAMLSDIVAGRHPLKQGLKQKMSFWTAS